ncbi:hypothetical protein MJH12_00905, partial [bacterium]|nr:hypothetical protein [bacterium]
MQDKILFVAKTSVFQIDSTGLVSWMMGASFDKELATELSAMKAIKWGMKAFEKTSPNSIMISAIVSD